MTVSVLQERQSSAGSATVTSFALAFSSTTTSGSSLHTASSIGVSNAITCSDGSNGAHTLLDNSTANGVGSTSHFNKDNSAAATITVTTAFASAGFPSLWIREIGGTSGIDTGHVLNNQNTGSGTTRTSGNLTPTVQPGLISAVFYNDTGTGGAADTGSGFTASTPASGWTFAGAVAQSAWAESKRYTSTSALAATFTGALNTDVTVVYAALYKESGVVPNAYDDDFGMLMDAIGGADSAFAEDDQSLTLMVADSAPVGPAQPPLPVQDDQPYSPWWEEYEDPLVEDSQWSGPILPNAPPQPVEDAWPWDDHEGDEWDGDSFPVSAPVPVAQPPEDPWLHEDDHTDEWETSDPVGLNQPAAPVEDAWDWTESDYLDDPPDDDGSNVQNANLIVSAANGPEDAWNWDEEATEDNWWDDCLDDGYNVQFDNVIPPSAPVVAAANQGGGGFVRGKKKKAGPYMREGQVFGEEYALSPDTGVKQPKALGTIMVDADYERVIHALMKELM